MKTLRAVGWICWKDLAIELRTGRRLTVMVAFAVLIAVLFNYSIDPGLVRPRDFVSGLLWLTIVFGGLLGLGQTFHLEEENGALEGVLLTPMPREALFLAKVLSNYLLVLGLVLLVLLLFGLFFAVDYGAHWLVLIAVLALGALGFVAVGTLFAAVTARSTMRETLLPVLVFPILLPVVIYGAGATNRLLSGLAVSEVEGNLRMLGAFALLTLTVGAILFRFVVEDA
ncbi:MAG: heme exporter protein CcmB [Gemmatimonadota bacterium]